MGAGFHTIHHTTYKHNYGHYFTFMDQLFGTLETPEEHEAIKAAKLATLAKAREGKDTPAPAVHELTASAAAPATQASPAKVGVSTRRRQQA